ncbi:late competence development ComFB family protein [Calderihabitans maritimus]|uniref:Late competence development protein ComFB n=1 Tax=Calderihabitans maritimus TaxID=1246530 RepID=A0A1Z5HVD2_9FIRM|nr:late competence development ComFB family protein [Calderihabitans maritimus]GAW93496.1 hypothetical protein KKC1_26280 [Calderihabitans maritimus]
MQLKNRMEERVWQAVDHVLAKMPEICNCERCRYDIAARALNNLPPRYYVSNHGEIYTRTEELNIQPNVDVLAAVTDAALWVAKNPHHGRD